MSSHTRPPSGQLSQDRASSSPAAALSPQILMAAANLLIAVPFPQVTLDDVMRGTSLHTSHPGTQSLSMHAIGAGILDHERASMRSAKESAFAASEDPLERLVYVFRTVGENLAHDTVVRAGVRIAAESRQYFPERRIDPFLTWERFVTTQLEHAHLKHSLRADIDIPGAVRIIVAAGMGTKDLVAFQDAWNEAPARFEETIVGVVELMMRERTAPHEATRSSE